MSIERLKQINKKASLILSPSDLDEVPIIHKSLPQLEKELKSMNEKIKSTHELQAKAHYFLASNGIPTEHVPSPINTSRTFEITPLEDNTNIEKFLQEEHEGILIDTVEKQRGNNYIDFENFFEKRFESFSSDKTSERMEEDENNADLLIFRSENNASGITRIHDYAGIVTSLNESRQADTDIDLIKQLSNVRNVSFVQKWQDAAYDSWNILQHLVTKSAGIEGRSEGRFLRNYTTQAYQRAPATHTRHALINASRTWLEQQSAQYVNDQVNKHATKIRVGGIPSISHRLRAFIDLIFKNANGWIDQRLEILEALPIWAYVYLLIRIGHMEVAHQFVDDHREMFASERRFIDYFHEYYNSEHHCLSEESQRTILADYQRLNYGDVVVDPYKILLYKIIGRCELQQKNTPDIIQTTEDYIWLQLMLVREVTDDAEGFSFERYCLEDVQKEISSLGSKYFDRDENNSNPWIYFKILLLTHQFEKAVEHLYKEKKLRLETVHFAVALVYHGLVRMTSPENTNSKNILIQLDKYDTLNFPHLIYQYVQVYIPELLKEALQYLCLLSLYSPKQGYPSNDFVDLAKQNICKFTIASNDFKALLGSRSNETRIPGIVDSVKDLLYISSEIEYVQRIINPIAETCVQRGKRMDAVYAYSLSGDFNKMVDALARELSDALQQPQSYRATDPTLSELSNEEIIQFALDTMHQYEQNQYVNSLIDDVRKNTIRILIQFLQFRVYYENTQYEIALQYMNQTNVIPLAGETRVVQTYVVQFQQLDESIKKNIPELMLNVMDIVYKIWVAYNDSMNVPESELIRLERNAQTILLFASLIQFSIPGDIIVRLNKVDRLMSLRRRR